MHKIIFLDVDGTLVDYHNRITESAIRAIRQARENGHLVYVCTGLEVEQKCGQNCGKLGLME